MKELTVINHSGGLDSSTLLLKALDEGHHVLPVVYNYGQKNIVEVIAQKKIHNALQKRYPNLNETMYVNVASIMSDVISRFQERRDNQEEESMKYYMPSRNLLFLSMSAVIGEILSTGEYSKLNLGLGIHKHSDIYERDYWDISPEFAIRMQQVLDLNDNLDIEVYAPFKDNFKSEIIKEAIRLKLPFELTWTCYNPTYLSDTKVRPCNKCEACRERESQAVIADSEIGIKINDYILELE